MNSFFVPQLGSQIYTMAGMATQLNLLADKPGTYPGLSAQFSGDGFADMRFDVQAVPQAEFESWVSTARGQGQALDTAAYTALEQQSSAVPVATYHDVDPTLFNKIVGMTVPQPEGQQAAPNATVSPRGGN
jgi:cytochrome o ubiquinol oxidase subunit II